MQKFLEDFFALFEPLLVCDGQLIFLADFNFNVDDDSDCDARQFMELIHSCGLEQHIQVPTREGTHVGPDYHPRV